MKNTKSMLNDILGEIVEEIEGQLISLDEAVKKGSVTTAELILNNVKSLSLKKSLIDSHKFDSHKLMGMAIKDRNVEMVSLLANVIPLNLCDDVNETGGFLFTAIKLHSLDMVKVLVQHGAHVNQFLPRNFMTPLIYACAVDDANIIEYLIVQGSKPSDTSYAFSFVNKNEKSMEMQLAVNHNLFPDPFVVFVTAVTDTPREDYVDQLYLKNPKMFLENEQIIGEAIVSKGELKTLEVFLNKASSSLKMNPLLQLACQSNSDKVISLLVNHGADPECVEFSSCYTLPGNLVLFELIKAGHMVPFYMLTYISDKLLNWAECFIMMLEKDQILVSRMSFKDPMDLQLMLSIVRTRQWKLIRLFYSFAIDHCPTFFDDMLGYDPEMFSEVINTVLENPVPIGFIENQSESIGPERFFKHVDYEVFKNGPFPFELLELMFRNRCSQFSNFAKRFLLDSISERNCLFVSKLILLCDIDVPCLYLALTSDPYDEKILSLVVCGSSKAVLEHVLLGTKGKNDELVRRLLRCSSIYWTSILLQLAIDDNVCFIKIFLEEGIVLANDSEEKMTAEQVVTNVEIRKLLNLSELKPEEEEHVSKCIVCLEKKTNGVFKECGHACICMDCHKENQMSVCPICRIPSGVVKLFFP